MIRSFGCTPNFLNYNGYPASICVSVNEEVVHGIPSKKRILKEGDIVSLDAGLIYEGYHSDAARTHAVGEISPEACFITKTVYISHLYISRPLDNLVQNSFLMPSLMAQRTFSVKA